MNILYVDTACDGHHLVYLKTLITLCKETGHIPFVMLPEKCELGCPVKIIEINLTHKRVWDYLKFLGYIKRTAHDIDADIIHVLNGDYFYRFMGLGLKKTNMPKVIFTFHSIRRGKIHDISLKRLFSKIDIGVVHAESLAGEIQMMQICNVRKIDYPCFSERTVYTVDESKERIGARKDIPLIGAIGGTREDKGLDVLFDALEMLNVPYQLLIAGQETYFTKEYIDKRSVKLSGRVICKLEYLSDEDMAICINACDILAIPYKRIFNGVSGPMVEGACLKKTIVASGHGSLGAVVRKHHIGVTFETECADSLKEQLDWILKNGFIYDSVADMYIQSLQVSYFKNSYLNLYSELWYK